MFDELFKQLLEHLTHQIKASEARLRADLLNIREAERISYNIDEAAQITGLGRDALYRACKCGKLQYSQAGTGSTIIIQRQNLIEYVSTLASTNLAPETGDVERPLWLHRKTL